MRTNVYHDLVEIPSAQKQYQEQHVSCENQYRTHCQNLFYGQVTYDNHRLA